MAGISEGLIDHGVSVFLCAIGDNPDLAKIHVDAMLDKQVDGIIATGKRIDKPLPVDLTHLSVPVVYALRERGVSVPGDVSVVGFDNWEIVAKETRPPLTTVDMNLKELGRQAG